MAGRDWLDAVLGLGPEWKVTSQLASWLVLVHYPNLGYSQQHSLLLGSG